MKVVGFALSSGLPLSGTVIAVAPTPTVLMPPLSLHQRNVTDLCVGLVNDNGSQTLDATVELGPTANGPWADSGYTGLSSIAAGETRSQVFGVSGQPYARIRGTASGAGLNCRIWVWQLVNT